MAEAVKLLAPINVSSKITNKAQREITVEWAKKNKGESINLYDSTKVDFAVQFFGKSDGKKIILPKTLGTLGESTDKEGYVLVVTMDATPSVDDVDKYYHAGVQAKPKKAFENAFTKSDWGKAVFWRISPSITLNIGTIECTLTLDIAGGEEKGIYKFVTTDEPLIITYDDLKDFAKEFGIKTEDFPTKFPNGDPIESTLKISEFIVDTKNKLFSLNVAADIGYEVFPGFKVKKLGLVLKRTDASL